MTNLTLNFIHDLDLHVLFPFNLDIYRQQVKIPVTAWGVRDQSFEGCIVSGPKFECFFNRRTVLYKFAMVPQLSTRRFLNLVHKAS